MEIRKCVSVCLTLTFLATSSFLISAQEAPNANAVYQQLRHLMPSGATITVNNFALKRDAAVFTFQSGSFAFYGEVNGKVTGAIFRGDGHVHIAPPTQQEQNNLALFTHSHEFDEDFDQAVLRFTDGTAAELHKASTGVGQDAGSFARPAQDLQSFLRHHSTLTSNDSYATYYNKVFYGNLDLRLLEDVLSPAPGGYFIASLHGSRYAHLFFILDPHGVEAVAPEEVALLAWDNANAATTYLLAFHRAEEYRKGAPTDDEENEAFKILHEDLDVTMERSGALDSVATVEVRAEADGVTVLPLDLYPSLRVSKAETDKGDPLDFVQEAKDLDPDFAAILAAPLKKGDKAKVRISYAGKDVVLDTGNGNYYPVARENWYPSSSQGLGDYATYNMVFHVPKGLQMVATGTKMNQTDEGKVTTTEWKTEIPLPVVGFSVGDFRSKEAAIGSALQGRLTLDAYANTTPPYGLNVSGSLGTLGALPMLGNELDQGRAAAQIYTQYYGELPFPHIALTEQTACNYGQSWPMLVYLPICAFFDTTQQHFLGLGGENLNKHMYWKVVTPHEVAHQWWGQTVGFRSYRDQWMSEGFADASAALYLLLTNPKPDQYLNFWKEERRFLTEKNAFGFRPIDVGPVTMGMRLSTGKTGWDIYGDLVYPKGAFILHMIQMMMWTPKDGDQRFKDTMHDFVKTYTLQPATTEDFKAMVEKHMSPAMNLDGNGSMDWFFNEYVYGTELPAYHFEGDATPTADGSAVHVNLVQSGVSDSFKALVPIYLELANGQIVRAWQMRMTGNGSYAHTLNVPKLPAPIKRVSINYYYDLLCTEN